ncbi:MAG: methionine adenosyltransferase [Bacteroidales bacterium]
MSYLFTSESVSEGHPDKVADQISDAILDTFLTLDPNSKVACETFVTTGLAVVGGEVKSNAYVDIQQVARDTINKIGYTKAEYSFDGNSCGVLSAIHEQSPDIGRGVERADPLEQGAGDQGVMFGYACSDTPQYMPLPLTLSHIALEELSRIRREGELMPYLRPDSKSQFTIEYGSDHTPIKIDTIVLSTQHDPFGSDSAMWERIERDVKEILIPAILARVPQEIASLFKKGYRLLVNPTGKFVIGGPHGDTGLTGRKVIVDTYGGRGAHGGGAFSGKDPSKVDRSASYAARYIAKNMVAAGVAKEILIQIAYAIGVAQPVSIFVDTFGTAASSKEGKPLSNTLIAKKIEELFDLRPATIIEKFGLKNPIYGATAAYGHFGRESYSRELKLFRHGKWVKEEVLFFGWERLDSVESIRREFGL